MVLCPEGGAAHAFAAEMVETMAKMIDVKTRTIDMSTSANVMDPFTRWNNQFKEIDDRIKERHKRVTEMDKLKNDSKHQREKNDSRVSATESRLGAVTQSYDELNKELCEDMTKLHEDRADFLLPLIANLVNTHIQFWQQMANTISFMQSRVSGVNLAEAATHPPVITPRERSSVSKFYAQSSSFDSSSTSNSTPQYNQPPPQQYNQPPPQQYNQPPPQQYNQGGYNQHPLTNSQNSGPPPINRQVPPPPQQQPGTRVRGLWDFNGQDPSELSFRKGDIINILEKNGEWWKGEINGRIGVLPANYVQST